MFLKGKFDGDGAFFKRNSRMVASTTDQVFADTSSPTVNTITVMSMLHIAAAKDYELAAYDCEGAFLGTPVDHSKDGRMFIRIPKQIVSFWLELKPEAKRFVSPNGCMYMELNKYLYGLHASSNRFHEHFKGILTCGGFKKSVPDPCLFVKPGRDPTAVGIHVDDMIVMAPSLKYLKLVEERVEPHFKLVKNYDDFSYLGMSIKRNRAKRTIDINMEGHLADIIGKFAPPDLKPADTPAPTSLFVDDPDPPSADNVGGKVTLSDDEHRRATRDWQRRNQPLDPERKAIFHSCVMSLMFPARLARGDFLLPVNYLSTKVAKPTERHYAAMMRVLRYVKGSLNRGITLGGDKIEPVVYADASDKVHDDGRGHGGLFMTLGRGPVFSRSTKLRLITLSSTESELLIVSDSTCYILWWIALLTVLGCPCREPVTVFQDNQSAMLMQNGHASFRRSKHIIVRDSFIKEHIDDGKIVLKYIPTEDMCADMLTKPLERRLFNRHVNRMFN
jgi:hypothetical protein